MLEVFYNRGSTPSWRVLLALAIKKAPYAPRRVELRRRDHLKPDYLALNPRGRVPVIRDGDFVLYESSAILVYLERRFPTPPLFGTDMREEALVTRHIAEQMAYFSEPLLAVVRPILYGGPGTAEAREREIQQGAARIRDELGKLDAALDGRSFLVGDRVSAADLFYFPSIKLAERASLRRDVGLAPLAERFPHVAAWCARIDGIEGCAAVNHEHAGHAGGEGPA